MAATAIARPAALIALYIPPIAQTPRSTTSKSRDLIKIN
jgi:hypothetical protein